MYMLEPRHESYRNVEPTFVKPFNCDQNVNFQKVPPQQATNVHKPPEHTTKGSLDFDTGSELNVEHHFETDEGNIEDNAPENNSMTNNITSLHSKLYYHLDNVTKWKIETECEYKQKDQKLKATCQALEMQKKAMFKVQLENEKLHLNLKEEIQARSEIADRVQATRDLFSTLKDENDRLEKKIAKWETIKSVFESLNHERMQEVEELSQKLQQINFEYNEKAEQLNRIVMQEQEDKKRFAEEMNYELSEAGKQLERYHDMVESKELRIQQLSGDLTNAEQHVDRLTKAQREYQLKLNESEGIISTKQNEVTSFINRVKTLETEKTLLEASLHEKINAYDSEKQTAIGLHDKLAVLQKHYEEEQKNLQCMKIQYERQVQEITEKSFSLEEQVEEMGKKNFSLVEQVEHMRKKNFSLDVQVEEMRQKNFTLEEQIEAMRKESFSLEEQLGDTKFLVEKQLKEIDNMKTMLKSKSEVNENLQTKIDSLLEEKSAIEIRLKEGENLLQVLKNEIHVKEEIEASLKKISEELKTEKADKDNYFCELRDIRVELRDKNTLIKELQDLNDVSSEDKEKISQELMKAKEDLNFLRGEKDVLSIHLKELTQEKDAVLDTRGQITADLTTTKEILKELEKTNCDLKASKEQMNYDLESLKLQLQSSENVSTELNEKIEDLKAQLQSTMVKAQEDEERHLNEKEESKIVHQCQMKELMHLLNNTQQDHHKTTMEKEEQLNYLKGHLELYKEKIKFEEIKELEIERLKNVKNELMNEINTLKNKMDDGSSKLQEQIQKLKKQISDEEKKFHLLEDENIILKEQLNEMNAGERKLVKYNTENKTLKQQLNNMKTQTEKMSETKEENETLKKQLEDLKEELSDFKDKNKKLKNQLNELKKELNQCAQGSKDLKKQVDRLNEQLIDMDGLQKKMGKLEIEKDELETKNKSLVRELYYKDELQKKVVTLESENHDLENQNKKLQRQLDTTNQDIVMSTSSTPPANRHLLTPKLNSSLVEESPTSSPAGILKKSGVKTTPKKVVMFTAEYESDTSAESFSNEITRLADTNIEAVGTNRPIRSLLNIQKKSPFVKVAPSPRTFPPVSPRTPPVTPKKRARLDLANMNRVATPTRIRGDLIDVKSYGRKMDDSSNAKTYERKPRKFFKSERNERQLKSEASLSWIDDDAFNIFEDNCSKY